MNKKNVVHIYEWGLIWGGIPTSIISLINELNEYNHNIIQLNNRVNELFSNEYKKNGANFYVLNKKLMDDDIIPLNPEYIFIHSCNKKYINPSILKRYKTITFYHYNVVDNNDYFGDLNWFVSEFLYKKTKTKPKDYIILPPPIFVRDFINIERPQRKPIIGRIQSRSVLKDGKFSRNFFNLLSKINGETFIVGPKNSNAEVIPGMMPKYLKEIDVFVIWGETTESWSLVTSEANLSGIPVVARRMNDGLTEQLNKSGGGILVDTEEEFIDMVNLLINDENKRNEIGQRGKYWCLENTSSKLIRSYLW